MVGVAIGVSAATGLVGSAMSSGAAKSAAGQQASAAEQAAQLQMQQYQQTRSDLLPYNTMGQANLNALQNQYGNTKAALGSAWNTAQTAANNVGTESFAQLEATPGYQFSLNQGLNATQANAASRGLGISGASMRGATNFATGLASNTYQNVFNQQNQQYQNASQQFSNQYNAQNSIYNQLLGPASLGENAAAMTGDYGTKAASNAGANIAAAGQAQAAGTTASSNALAGGLSNTGGLAYLYALQGQNAAAPATTTATNPITGGTYQAATNPNDVFVP